MAVKVDQVYIRNVT